MAYSLPQIQTPDIAGSYSKGLAIGQQAAERKRRQPILEQLEQMQLQREGQALERGQKQMTLQDLQIEDHQRKEKSQQLQDIGMAAQWADTPEKWGQALDFYESQGEDLSPFRDRYDMRETLIGLTDPDYAKQQKVMEDVQGLVQQFPEEQQPQAAALGAVSPKALVTRAEKQLFTPIEDLDDKLKKEKSTADREEKLRKEHSKESKTFKDVSEAYQRLQSSEDTSAGDMSIVFQFMKMLDPASTVREGEFATAEQVGGAAQKYMNTYNRLAEGDRLTPSQRGQFLSEAENLYTGTLELQTTRDAEYKRLAADYGVKPENVVLRRTEILKKKKLVGADKQALDWVNANPNDPRAAAILQRLESK